MRFCRTRLKKAESFFVIAVLLSLNSGCHYYKYTEVNTTKFGKLEQLIDNPNYLIIHHKGEPLNLIETRLDYANAVLIGKLRPVSPKHSTYRDSKYQPGEPIFYRKRITTKDGPPITYIVHEVHIYLNDEKYTEGKDVSIPIDKINKIEKYDRHHRTNISFIVPSVIVGAVIIIYPIYSWLLMIAFFG